MLDNFCCTVVKPWSLLLQMRQHCIGWSIVWYIYIYIYILYMYISYIIICRICSRHKVSLTWHLKPINLNLCYDACSTELASLTKEQSCSQCLHKKSHQRRQSCAWMLAIEQVWAPLKVTLHVVSTPTLAQRYFNFNLLPSSVASLTFSLRLIMNCDQAQYY